MIETFFPRNDEERMIAYFRSCAGEGSFNFQDDAAVHYVQAGESLVLTSDCLTSGIHFFAEDSPRHIIQKAIRVNISDLAAKGATPCAFLLNFMASVSYSNEWMQAFVSGLHEECERYHLRLLGGDTIRLENSLTLSISMIGKIPPAGRFIPRNGVSPRDRLYVTGTIGDSAIGLRLHPSYSELSFPKRSERREISPEVSFPPWQTSLSADEKDYLCQRYLLPVPRVEAQSLIQTYATGSLDISDGLIGDMQKMLKTSKVGGEINIDFVPLSSPVKRLTQQYPFLLETALTGGDDYELCLSVPEKYCTDFEQEARKIPLAITHIGQASSSRGEIHFHDSTGRAFLFKQPSFAHSFR